MAQFSAKTCIETSLWDTPSGREKGKSKKAVELNNPARQNQCQHQSRFREIFENKGSVSAHELKAAFQGMAFHRQTLVDYFSRHNKQFAHRIGVNHEKSTCGQYKNSLKHLFNFLQKKYRLTDIPFTSLDRSFIEAYDSISGWN